MPQAIKREHVVAASLVGTVVILVGFASGLGIRHPAGPTTSSGLPAAGATPNPSGSPPTSGPPVAGGGGVSGPRNYVGTPYLGGVPVALAPLAWPGAGAAASSPTVPLAPTPPVTTPPVTTPPVTTPPATTPPATTPVPTPFCQPGLLSPLLDIVNGVASGLPGVGSLLPGVAGGLVGGQSSAPTPSIAAPIPAGQLGLPLTDITGTLLGQCSAAHPTAGPMTPTMPTGPGS